MKRSDIIVRDVRIKSHFFVDDEYLNGYAKLCGPNATLVYFCLCRHADSNQKSFPSISLMAKKVGVSNRSIDRGIAILADWNIIAKTKMRNEVSGRWWNNSYLLLDKSVWKPKPHASLTHGEPSAKSEGTVRHTVKNHTPHSRTKDSHIRIHIEGLESLEEEKKNTLELLEKTGSSLRSKGLVH